MLWHVRGNVIREWRHMYSHTHWNALIEPQEILGTWQIENPKESQRILGNPKESPAQMPRERCQILRAVETRKSPTSLKKFRKCRRNKWQTMIATIISDMIKNDSRGLNQFVRIPTQPPRTPIQFCNRKNRNIWNLSFLCRFVVSKEGKEEGVFVSLPLLVICLAVNSEIQSKIEGRILRGQFQQRLLQPQRGQSHVGILVPALLHQQANPTENLITFKKHIKSNQIKHETSKKNSINQWIIRRNSVNK